ncbi:MAG: NAD-dependent epimerase/dehydratase family protein [Planctomycetota bacterium]|jgi:UDP-glucose 4-epimerase
MARYLVTGGAGFVGSHLVAALLSRGDEVSVLDDFSTGTRENLDGIGGQLQVVEGSVLDPEAVAEAMAAVAGVFHLAALSSVVESVKDPARYHEVNATGTLRVLAAARRVDARVVYAGSASAYGNPATIPETGIPESCREDPQAPYAAAKMAGELYCRSFAAMFQLPVVITRFFNVYGPKQPPDSPYAGVVAAFCRALLSGAAPTIYGDGEQTRDFTYVSDVVRGCILAMTTPLQGCHTVNVATGRSLTVRELLDTLAAHTGTTVAPEHREARKGDVRHSRADISRARELLGYVPEISCKEGLTLTLDWYRSVCA